MVVGGDCDGNEGEGDDDADHEGLGFDIEILSWNERFKVLVEIESSGHRAHNLLRYGSWGELCACILWYREERRKGERLEIYGRDISPCSSHRVSDL